MGRKGCREEQTDGKATDTSADVAASANAASHMPETACGEIVLPGYIRLSLLVSAILKNLEKLKASRVRALNLKNAEVFIMFMLQVNPEGLSAEELAQSCEMDRSLISRYIPSLMEKGYIEFRNLSAHKRRYGNKIVLTESGRRIGEIMYRWAYEIQTYLDRGISREQLENMYATLTRLREGFERLNRETGAEISED